MDRKVGLRLGLEAVFLIVFNIIFFVMAGVNQPISVWIAYGFIHFAYVMMLLTPILTKKSSSASVFGFSIISLSTVYFIVEFVVGIIIIFSKPEVYQASLIIQLIIAGVYAIMLLSVLLANEHSAESIEKHEAEITYIKTQSSRINALITHLQDKQLQKELEKTYDLLHSSPSKTNSSVYSIEQQIKEEISALEEAVYDFDKDEILRLTKSIQNLGNERNRILSIH